MPGFRKERKPGRVLEKNLKPMGHMRASSATRPTGNEGGIASAGQPAPPGGKMVGKI